MTLPDLLATLDSASVRLSLKLGVDAPAGVITLELKAALTEHKPTLLRRLAADLASPSSPPVSLEPTDSEPSLATVETPNWPPRPPELATWPDVWRERWGRRANERIDAGHDWRLAEQTAFAEVETEMAAGAELEPTETVPLTTSAFVVTAKGPSAMPRRETTPSLFASEPATVQPMALVADAIYSAGTTPRPIHPASDIALIFLSRALVMRGRYRHELEAEAVKCLINPNELLSAAQALDVQRELKEPGREMWALGTLSPLSWADDAFVAECLEGYGWNHKEERTSP